jgi:hypothetical protein
LPGHADAAVIVRWLACAAGLGLLVALSGVRSAAQGPRPSTFPRDRAALRAALCPRGAACRVESILDAGHDGTGRPLAVVHLGLGARPGDEGCHGYTDQLATVRGGRVVSLRELSRGDVHCLEWTPSRWSFVRGELVFVYTGMGAPPSADTDMRPVRTTFRPWPLAITGRFRGTEAETLPPMPASGPLFVLSMDYEGETL